MSMRYAKLFALVGLVASFALQLSDAMAQTNYGAVRGRITDVQGGVIANVSVTLVNEGTIVGRSSVTNQDGDYLFTAVDPGQYTVTATMPGFKKLEQKDIVVGIGTTATADGVLQIGAQVEEIDVVGQADPLIDTASASEGQTFDEQKLQDLPNLGRNPFVFDKLDNNVTPTGDPRFVRAEDQSGTSSVSVSGAPIGANNYVVDGIPVSTSSGGATFIPSLEAVSDAKVQANTYDAEVGRTGGGVFNTTLKSGTSTYHGTLYGETRQTPWTANTWQNNLTGISRPDSTTYLYAGAFGGPLPYSTKVKYLTKTFFWLSEEGYRQAQPYTSSTNSYYVPTVAERTGDFSAYLPPGGVTTCAAQPGYFVICNPVTGLPVPGNKLAGTGLINPIGEYIANQFPLPTTSGIYNAGAQNFFGSNDFKTRSDMYSGKMDHVFTPWWSASASYVHLATQEPNGSILNVFAESNGVIHRFNDATAVNNVFVLNPTTILTVGYGFNRYYSDTLQYSSGFNQANGFGGAGFPTGFVSQLQSATFPTITLSSVTNAASIGAATSGPTVNASKNVVIGIEKTIGKQNIKAGYVFRSMNDFVSSASGGNGSYTFSGQYSDGSGKPSSNSPYAIADLLMGLPGSSSTASTVTINAVGLTMNEKYHAFYAQDDFRLTVKLTINVGLRYEYELGQKEATNRYNVGFDSNVTAVIPAATPQTVHGGLAFAGVGNYPTHCCDESHIKFAPRFGGAYEVRKGTVVRAGFGVFYSPVGLTPYSTGYSQATNYVNTAATGLTASQVGPNAWLSNPFSGSLLAPTGNTLGALSGIGGSLTAQAFGRRFPLVDQYSVDVEQELPGGFALKLGYVGAHARNFGQVVNVDQLSDSIMASYAPGGPNYSTSTNLSSSVSNPYYATSITAPNGTAYPQTGTIAKSTATRAQLLLPYPQFTAVTLQESNGASRYNAMDLKIQKRLSKGLSILATYTWSSNWDNLYGSTSSLNSSTAGMQDNYNLGGEWARAINDMPNRVTAAATYVLPVGRGMRYFSGMNRWLDYAVGGWQVNDEWIDQNGSPLAITQSDLNSGGTFGATSVGGSTQRPNFVAGVNPCYSGRPQARDLEDGHRAYFNVSAFTAALPYTYGNVPRTLPCKGPGYDNQDISVFKSFKVKEGVNVQFRAEALNAMNTPELGTPNTTLAVASGYTLGAYASSYPANGFNSPTSGQINSQLGFGRIIQLGGRVTF